MGCGAENACPATTAPVEDWGLDDPEGQSMDTVRRIRNEIDARVKLLIDQVGL
jgi:arsenate reductase